jgi:hypothetical protein
VAICEILGSVPTRAHGHECSKKEKISSGIVPISAHTAHGLEICVKRVRKFYIMT